MLSFAHQMLWKMRCHKLLVFQKDAEELFTQDGQILLLQKLRVDLTQLVELGVHLILGNGALVSNEVLELLNLRLVLLLEVLDVLLRDLNITLQLQDVNQVLSFVCQFLFEIVNLIGSSGIFNFIQHFIKPLFQSSFRHSIC